MSVAFGSQAKRFDFAGIHPGRAKLIVPVKIKSKPENPEIG